MLSISVTIPTFRRQKLLEKIITTLEKQTTHISEIIIIDNDPQQSARRLTYHPISKKILLKYIVNKKGGAPRARNLGLKKSSGTIAAFLDDDCIPDKKWAENILKFFSKQQNRKIILLGENINGIPESAIASVEFYLTKLMFMSDFYQKNRITYSLGLDTKNFAVYRTQLIRDKILFDNRYQQYTYYEDMDFGIQARQKGYKIVYEKNVSVEHMGRTTIAHFIKRERMKVKAFTIFQKKWHITKNLTDNLQDVIADTHKFYKRDYLSRIIRNEILKDKSIFFILRFHMLLLFSENLYRFGQYFEKK